MMLPGLPYHVPVVFCTDADVLRYCETEASNFNPYHSAKSARDVFQAARAKFGDYRCWDLLIYEH